MKLSIAVAVIWVLAATVVAFLPMRQQFRPGSLLLIAAPPVILWLARDYGWLAGLVALAGFVSMFRHPLAYLWDRLRSNLRGQPK